MLFRSFILAIVFLPGVSLGQPEDPVPITDPPPIPGEPMEGTPVPPDPDEHGEDAFQFTYPEPDSEIALNTYQTVRVRWLRDSGPVVDGKVSLRSDLGEIEDEVTTTGLNGVATFAIRSTEPGIATLQATTPDLSEPRFAQLVVRFSATAPSDGPFGDLAVQRTLDRQLPLWILTDRVGFLARGSVSIEDVARIAADEGLTQLTPLSDGMFVLKVDHMPADPDPERFLRELARQLEEDHPEVFLAGLVAQIVGTGQWLVVPDQLIARFESGLSEDEIKNLVIDLDPTARFERAELDSQRYVITLDAGSNGALQIASELSAMTGQVVYAEPNYVIAIDLRGDPTTDQGYSYQWHHENAGTYATADADIDSAKAWSFGYGSPDVTVAVIDRGFDINHPDLVDNLACDSNEWCADFGKRAINVTKTNPQMSPNPTDLLSTSFNAETLSHGTRAAGVAAERGGNVIGYSGACPECRLMLIRNEGSLDSVATAFEEAVAKNVDVISNSWGFTLGGGGGSPGPAAIINAIKAAVGAGIPVVFAMTNEELDNCGALLDISCLPQVIGVSGITDYDERSKYSGEALGYGTGMDVLAPTRGGAQGIRTTSVVRLQSGVVASAYWHDFSGTSAATPMVAGVIGLMKSHDADLSPLQIQRILQDTADRVDPQHANYSPESGFSDPGGKPTHGYGRINASEATRLVAPVNPGTTGHAAGRGGSDLLLRDHGLDWGNTPSDVILDAPRKQYTLHQSADIKIDVAPFQPFTNDPAGFAELVSEQPEAGKQLQVFVRVRNRGPYTVQNADLKLHHAIVTDTFPDFPADFWTKFPADASASAWAPLPSKQLSGIRYSGPSVAGCPARLVPECLTSGTAPVVDAAQIVTFMVPPLDWDATAGQRIALLAVVDSAQDPVQTKSPNVVSAVTQDSNVTLWTVVTEMPECAPWVVPLIYVLLILAVVLIVWIIWRWISGQPVAIGVYLVLVVVIGLLIAMRLAFPECSATAIDELGL